MDNFQQHGNSRGVSAAECTDPNCPDRQGLRQQEHSNRGQGYNSEQQTYKTTGQSYGQPEGLGERIMDKVQDFASGRQGQGLMGSTGLTGSNANYGRQNESLGERIKDRVVQGVISGGLGGQFNNAGRPYNEGGQEFAGSSARPMTGGQGQGMLGGVQDKLEQGARMIGLRK